MPELAARKRGNKWEYRFEGARIDGKRQQFSKSGFATKKEALEAGARALSQYNQAGTFIVPSEISFSDYLDYWLDKYCKNNLKPATITNYQKKIRLHIKPILGQYKLKALSPTVLQNFISDKFNEGYSRNTLSVIKGILSNSLSYAVEPLKYIESSPMLYVKLPSKRAIANVPTRSAPHIFIPKNKMQEIFERFPEGTSTHLPLMLGYKCGLRLGEAYGLFWEDIDFEKQLLSVNRQVQWHEKENQTSTGYWYFTNPKYDSFRKISIDNELTDLLKRIKDRSERAKVFYDDMYIQNYESDHTRMLNTEGNGNKINLVLVRDSGEFIQPRTMQHTSNIIHTKLDYPEFDFHSLRHTHCSMLLEAGASPKYVQERLGHKNIQVTMQIYQHLTDNMIQQGDEVLNKLF
jgi:integrase